MKNEILVREDMLTLKDYFISFSNPTPIMSIVTLQSIQFDPTSASEELFSEYFDVIDTWILEINPNEKIESRETRKKAVKKTNLRKEFIRWLFYSEKIKTGKAIGYAILRKETEYSPNFELNKNIGIFNIYIRKEFRYKGFETIILRKLAQEATKLELSVLQSATSVESEQEIFDQLGGKIVLEKTINYLYLADINWNLMEEWRLQGMQLRKEGVIIESFQNVPEDIIEEFVTLYTETINQQPYGDYEGRPKITIESRRRDEEYRKEREIHWITIITREADGSISGLTEVVYNPEVQFKVEQLLTGVKEEYRGRGLGKWLKSEMAFYIKHKFPKVEYISTGNIDTNAPMLTINKRMGFKPVVSFKHYKFECEQLIKKLNNNLKHYNNNIG